MKKNVYEQQGFSHLGKQAKDVITGFAGTVMGYCLYLTGCHQILLSPKCKEDGTCQDSRWFDLDRIEITDHVRVQLVSEKTGASRSTKSDGPDMPAPIR